VSRSVSGTIYARPSPACACSPGSSRTTPSARGYSEISSIGLAVANLIESAVEFGTRATVRLSPAEGGRIVIDVIDDGPRIPNGERETMTEPFARGDASRNRDGSSGGFGLVLGLAVVRSVAEAHGGRLSRHDARPHGLIARMILPAGYQP